MPTDDLGLDKTFAALGVIEAAQVAARFEQVFAHFDAQLKTVHEESTWKQFRDAWLGRKSGVLTQVTDNWLKPATPELKRVVGQKLNELRAYVELHIEARRASIESQSEQAALARERVDLSLPGVIHPIGSRHLIRQVFQEAEDIFFSIGFSIVEGPEIETPYYNFEALNIPEFHPVRDDMDTFYIDLPRARRLRCCCARTPLLCRFEPWKSKSRPCASSFPGRSIAATIPTPRIPSCSTKSKALPWTRTSPSAISPALSNIS